MEIHRLTLADFRNYEKEEIVFSSGTNVIYGDNAQGKTNLLEAVWMFSHGRSRRAVRDGELVRFGRKMFRLSLSFSDSVRDYEAAMQVSSNGRKTVKINNVAITKLSQLLSYLNVVMFAPSEIDIVKGSPSLRRRFMDEAISQMFPKYVSELSEYHKALEQKNELLKQLRIKGVREDAMLSVWNEQLAKSGSAISQKRREFIDYISASAAEFQTEISGEILKILYTPSIECDIMTSEEYFEKLEKNQRREIENGASLIGIQRDDIKIKIGEKDARLYGSQGQQRTAVLSMKLAQTEYIHELKNEYPVLLLDDIMSELDVSRRKFLLGKIKDKQVLITTTDAEGIEDASDTSYFKISNGRLVR